jgi:malonyl-CoA decarboxylase
VTRSPGRAEDPKSVTTQAEGRIQRPFLNRALQRVRHAWSELASSRSTRRHQVRPHLPPADLEKVKKLMLGCVREPSVATAARAQAASLGYIYLTLDEDGRQTFLRLLAEEFDVSAEHASSAVEAYRRDPGIATYAHLQDAVRPARVQLLKMLNSLPDGFKFLVDLRADLITFLREEPSLEVLDHDLRVLFEGWFDVGLLSFEAISWNSPASLLEKLIAYEAVHEIRSWQDLKNRLEGDRRCYAFFHPKIPDEPLIFVEVALTRGTPGRIDDLLDVTAPSIDAHDADTAVFYSISNTQKGLRGISFGSFLLKQVMDRLVTDLPGLKTFVTLSPIPGFRRWLIEAASEGRAELLLDEERWWKLSAAVEEAGAGSLGALLSGEWHRDETIVARLEEPLVHLCAYYLLHERNGDGAPLDPVERFHVVNGASVERLNWMADVSAKGFDEALGMMVNYRYEAASIEKNYERALRGAIAASSSIEKLDRIDRRGAAT